MKRTITRLWRLAACAAALVSIDRQAGYADPPLPRVPDGFSIEVVAAPPLVEHPMLAGFDERGRLFIAESAGQNLRAAELLENPPNFVRLLEDTDGDGVFDKSTIFADKLAFPQGALWYRGALYVASPPGIWRLEDTTGDGVADQREEIVGKFGFTGNAADVHGCFLGPEGRIYWCDGRHGHEFIDEKGNVTSKGKAARIFSCLPDGSDVRVFAGGGMDNPVEIDFTEEGEMLGTVNIFHNPRGDCLVHWVEGGVYPRHDQEDCIAEFQRTGDLLPAVKDLGHVAVSGMMRYRSDQFGPEYLGNLFITEFNTHKVIRSVLTRSGATFASREEEFLVSDDPDFHPTDVLEDADGSLLVIDTGGWFRIGCPTSQIARPEVKGAIYRIRRNDAPPVRDPRGLTLNLEQRTPKELAERLDDPRPAVRERAVDLLAQSGAPGRDGALAEHATSVVARRNAVWVQARAGIRPDVSATVREIDNLQRALDDEDESVRLAAVHAVGPLLRRQPEPRTIERLTAFLSDDSFALRREAATSLGLAGEQANLRDAGLRRNVVAVLLESTAATANDRILEHALIYALIQIADRETTAQFLSHLSPRVRLAALVALDQMDGGSLTRDEVVPLLDTDDPALQKEALAVIGRRAGWAAETLALLREWLADAQGLTDERASMLRGLLLARCADAGIQQLVAEHVARQQTPPAVLLLLLEVMQRAALDAWPEAWTSALEQALACDLDDARLQAIRIVQQRQMERFDVQLRALVRDGTALPDLRVEALIALAPRLESLEGPLFDFLLARLDDELPPLEQLAAARALSEAKLSVPQLKRLSGVLDQSGPLALPVLLRAFNRSVDFSPHAQETRPDEQPAAARVDSSPHYGPAGDPEVGRALVAALDRSPAASNLSPDELAALLRAYPEDVQAAAAGLFERLGVDPQAQQTRLEELMPLTNGGDPERGRAVYFGRKAACATCHTVAGEGGNLGPDLTRIGTIRTGRDLLEAIVFPSASFAREYRTYVIVTDLGRVHTGVIGRQAADSITLRTADLAEIRIPRSSIEEMQESPTSIMPRGLDETLTPDELRNLLAYLRGLR